MPYMIIYAYIDPPKPPQLIGIYAECLGTGLARSLGGKVCPAEPRMRRRAVWPLVEPDRRLRGDPVVPKLQSYDVGPDHGTYTQCGTRTPITFPRGNVDFLREVQGVNFVLQIAVT